MILAYHPIFDAYHCAFRLVRILSHKNIRKIQKDKLRILDYYLLFPALIGKISMIREHGGWKKELMRSLKFNKYDTASVSKQVFNKLEPFHIIAIDFLKKTEIITIDKSENISLNRQNIPESLMYNIEVANEYEQEVIEFICGILNSYELFGKKGLKCRTGLLEHKYDAI